MPAQPGSYTFESRGVQLIEKKADTAGIASNTGCWLLLGPVSTGFHYHFQRFQCPFNSSAFVDAKAPKIHKNTNFYTKCTTTYALCSNFTFLTALSKTCQTFARPSFLMNLIQTVPDSPFFFPPPSLRCELLWRHVPPSKHDSSEGIVPHLYQLINISMKF